MPRISHVRHTAVPAETPTAPADLSSVSPIDWVNQNTEIGDALKQYGPYLQIIAPLATKILEYLSQGKYIAENGQVHKMAPGKTTRDIVSTWDDMLDRVTLGGVSETLKKEKRQQEDRILMGFYRARNIPPEQIDQFVSNPSLERLAIKGAMLFQKQDKALKMLTEYLKERGVNDTNARSPMAANIQAKANLATQMYRAASDMSIYNPWQGGSVDDRLHTLLEMESGGAFKDLMRTRGVFKPDGTFTPYGYVLAQRRIEEAGRTMNLARAVSGEDTYTGAMSTFKKIFGERTAAEMADPKLGHMLGTYLSMARVSGVTNAKSRLQLLRSAMSVTGAPSLMGAIRTAIPTLSFNQVANMSPDMVNEPKWNELTMRAAQRAANGKNMLISGAAVSALADKYRTEYGMDSENSLTLAHNTMDSVLGKGLFYKDGLFKETSKILGRTFDWRDVRSRVYDPRAVNYARSGRAMPMLIQAEAAQYWWQVKAKSPWLTKHAGRILQETKGLGLNNVAAYLDAHNVDGPTRSRIMQHVSSVGASLGTDTDALLKVVEAGTKMRQRTASMRQAYSKGYTSYALSHMQQSSGLEGATRSVTADGATLTSALAGLLGTGRSLTETPDRLNSPDSVQPINVVPTGNADTSTAPTEPPGAATSSTAAAPTSSDPQDPPAPVPAPAPAPAPADDDTQAYSPIKPPEFRPTDPLADLNKEQMA